VPSWGGAALAPIVDARRFDERKAFLTQTGEDMLKPAIGRGELIVFRMGRMKVLTEAYFILNESYKAWRIKPGHYTEESKIAALTCAAIMKILPFRPQTLNMAKTVGEYKCNEIYALNCAAVLLTTPIGSEEDFKQDFWLRLLDILSDVRCRTLDKFVADINGGKQGAMETYVGEIHRGDHLEINCLISIFELLCNRHKKALQPGP
jgi:hypothetical protein